MDLKVELDNQLYVACIYGKAHRLKFVSRQKAKQLGKLISADSEVTQAIEDMLAHAKNLVHNIKEVLSNNGGEFDNENVKSILKKSVIIQRLTASYTPQQNGGRKPLKNCEVAVEIPLPEPNRQLPEAENEGQNDPEDSEEQFNSESEDEEKSNIMKLRNRSELKKPKSLKIKSSYKPGVLKCFSDANFGCCIQTGRSTSRVVVLYAGGAISWLSQRQAMVATSTTKTEIVASNKAGKDII
ncbi:hypothetical protein AVEN_175111-1 [Araneus ventricosus]|uniref:Integrase catalytic domain-containing protein n=1 Tax=Araneus ventricosus TaxID=182803 RepID=A0A4Y2HA51_ARAVE|nr:hypothetical protein AVEN_175111-1 [Araneus ventricosus]